MIKFFLSPIPVILVSIIYIAMAFVDDKKWKKVFKYLLVIVLGSTILFWLNSFGAKIVDSNIYSHAMLVSSVTRHIEKLLSENKVAEAEQIIEEFNLHYEGTFYSHDELEKFLKEKNIPIYNRVLEESKKQMELLEEKKESEQTPSLRKGRAPLPLSFSGASQALYHLHHLHPLPAGDRRRYN